MSILDKYVKLSRQLMPTGRAFRLSFGFNSERLHKALAVSEAKFYTDSKSTLYSLIPDNDQFTAEDATDWERRLGIISSSLVPLADRKLAILRKMASPGINPARSGAKWFEKQLRDAGFDVYVHENIYPTYPSGFERINPSDFNPTILESIEYDMFDYGEVAFGEFDNYIIANSIYNDEDLGLFNAITDNACSFFIGGETFGTFANVLATREVEFRQLVCSQKQTQMIAFCFIHFV